AFYATLSLAPLMLIVVSMAAFVFGQAMARDEIMLQANNFLGSEGARALSDMLASANHPKAGVLASLAGLLVLLYGASGVFGELRSALNKLWDAHPQSSAGFLGWVKDNIFS